MSGYGAHRVHAIGPLTVIRKNSNKVCISDPVHRIVDGIGIIVIHLNHDVFHIVDRFQVNDEIWVRSIPPSLVGKVPLGALPWITVIDNQVLRVVVRPITRDIHFRWMQKGCVYADRETTGTGPVARIVTLLDVEGMDFAIAKERILRVERFDGFRPCAGFAVQQVTEMAAAAAGCPGPGGRSVIGNIITGYDGWIRWAGIQVQRSNDCVQTRQRCKSNLRCTWKHGVIGSSGVGDSLGAGWKTL